MAKLTDAQVALHQVLIRNAKHLLGTARLMLDAWENYVRSETPPPTVIQDPDPVKHFTEEANRRR